MATKKTVDFEASMKRLEEILRLLESGNASLDDSLKLYEEGIGLVRACSERLDRAEQTVKKLQLTSEGTVGLVDFEKSGEDAE